MCPLSEGNPRPNSYWSIMGIPIYYNSLEFEHLHSENFQKRDTCMLFACCASYGHTYIIRCSWLLISHCAPGYTLLLLLLFEAMQEPESWSTVVVAWSHASINLNLENWSSVWLHAGSSMHDDTKTHSELVFHSLTHAWSLTHSSCLCCSYERDWLL